MFVFFPGKILTHLIRIELPMSPETYEFTSKTTAGNVWHVYFFEAIFFLKRDIVGTSPIEYEILSRCPIMRTYGKTKTYNNNRTGLAILLNEKILSIYKNKLFLDKAVDMSDHVK